MTSDLPLRALNRAIGLRQPGAGVIHHSDRGSQYCSDAYQARLGELGFLASMSGKGNCYDNAVVETFFKTIKSELIWRTVFMSRSQAETAIAGYIDGFYNHSPSVHLAREAWAVESLPAQLQWERQNAML